MPLQDVAPLPADPLASLTSDYEHAVLHLAWDLHKVTHQRTLLFSWVELLPTEVPPPEDDVALDDLELKLGGKSNHRVYVRHVTLSAERARRWYLECRQGTAVLPEDDGRLPDDDEPQARRVQLGDLGEEPPWPNLVCVKDKETVVPFCPQWHDCPRVHHLIPLVDLDLKKLWSKEQERGKAIQFLTDRLHFKLGEYPEYWGSAHLVAPNPVFRSISGRRQPTSTEHCESQLFRIQPRADKDLGSLELLLQEDRPSGLGTFSRAPVQNPVVRVTFDHDYGGHRRQIYDQERGLLASGSYATVRSVKGSIYLDPSRTRVVSGPDPYTVPIRQPESMTFQRIGNYRPSAAKSRMYSAKDAHRKQTEAAKMTQRWFHGAKEEAAWALRELLYDAEQNVLIVDPYFGAAELHSFGLAIGKIDVPVFVLAATERLKDKTATNAEVEKWDPLLTQLQHVLSQPYANKISIRVMEGEKSPIHDRFLVVDDRIWILGSSLNEFGSRGTMMVALPDPAPIGEKLFKAWHQAEELEAWAAGRKERRKPNDREARQ